MFHAFNIHYNVSLWVSREYGNAQVNEDEGNWAEGILSLSPGRGEVDHCGYQNEAKQLCHGCSLQFAIFYVCVLYTPKKCHF